MKFTKAWIKKWSPCRKAVDWFYAQKQREVVPVLKALLKEGKYDWANWAVVRCMNRKQRLRYAIYAAKLVALPIFEKKYPDDKRPREAIKAAKICLKRDTKKNRKAAAYAADAAYAAYAAYAADAADAAYAAYAADAAYAAYAADVAYAAYAAYAAADAAAYAADAAYAAYVAAYKKILNYGIRLLKR